MNDTRKQNNNAEDYGFESACSLLFLFIQHLRLRYFNAFKTVLDFFTMTLIDVQRFYISV
jgi:hypothetical protein